MPCPYRDLLIIGIRLRIVARVFKLKTISDLVNLLKSFKQLFSVTFVPIASTAPADPGLQCTVILLPRDSSATITPRSTE